MSEKVEDMIIKNHLDNLAPTPMSGNEIDMLLFINHVNSLHSYWEMRSIELLNHLDEWINQNLYENISENDPIIAQKYVDFLRKKLNIINDHDIMLILNNFEEYNLELKKIYNHSKLLDISNLTSYIIFIDFCTLFSKQSSTYLIVTNNSNDVSQLTMLDYFLGCVHLLEYVDIYNEADFNKICIQIYGLLKDHISDDTFGKYAIRYASEKNDIHLN